MYYVYILENVDKKLYIGLSEDLKRRLKEHNFGNSDFTSRSGPWRIIYYEVFINKQDAHTEEEFLKSGKGRERIQYLLKNLRRGG